MQVKNVCPSLTELVALRQGPLIAARAATKPLRIRQSRQSRKFRLAEVDLDRTVQECAVLQQCSAPLLRQGFDQIVCHGSQTADDLKLAPRPRSWCSPKS